MNNIYILARKNRRRRFTGVLCGCATPRPYEAYLPIAGHAAAFDVQGLTPRGRLNTDLAIFS